MRKKKLFILLSLSLLVLTACSNTKSIHFGSADVGGMYYSFANTFSGLASQENPDYKFEVKNTAGSAANLRLLSNHYIELGIAQEDLILDAYQGSNSFNGKKYDGYKAIASLYTEACQIIVRKDSSIQSLDDLQGKTISIGAKESGTERNAKEILEMSGLTSELVHTVQLDYTNAAKELISGKIDALFCTAGIQTTVIEELSKECEIRFLNISDTCLKKLQAAHPCYSRYTIPANTYTGQTESIETIGVKSILLASDQLSKDTVSHITAMLFEHAKELKYSTSVDLQLDEQTATSGITIPFHPGAIDYYEKKGIKVS